MTRKGFLVIAGIFVAAFLLLVLAKCGYRKLGEKMQGLEQHETAP